MLVSTNWIKDFVALPQDLTPKQLGEKFTLATAEVEEVIAIGAFLEKVRVAQIQAVRKHPEADKLNLVTFRVDDQETKEVVCGAPNVREGLKVAYAPLGTTLPNGLTLEAKKIRGVLSEGMLCSESELGLGDGKAGLMELENDTPVGTTLKDYLGANSDLLLDIDNKSLTHRPDLWGHYGMAREFAAAFKLNLKNPYDDQWQDKLEKLFNEQKAPITPQVEKASSCLGYYTLCLDDIEVGKSPQWLRERLEATGLRSINNIVDISNYVMLELGMPLHIFDRDTISGNKLFIKEQGREESFTTLDEEKRSLLPTDTVIADAEKPLVLAGIMGGLNSGVTDKTNRILIEVANWKAEEVRRTSTRLGLRTDSSQRYEKSLDTNLCYRTLLRTLELIVQLCPGAKVIGRPHYDGIDLTKGSLLTLVTSREKICRVLGKDIDEKEIIDIFTRLDFSVQKKSSELIVTIPTFRTTKDIECEADLIEEVGRLIGYDNITPEAPLTIVRPVRLLAEKKLARKIQDYLVQNTRALEVMTYPLVGKKLLSKSQWPQLNEKLVLINSLSQEHDRMRPSIIPSAVEAVAKNAKHFSDFSFFELGRSYQENEKSFSVERSQLLVALYSRSHNRFIELVNCVEGLLNFLNLPFSLERDLGKFTNPILPKEWAGGHPHEYLHLKVMGRFMGAINTVHPLLMRQFKTKGNASFAVIDLTDFETRPPKEKVKYRPLSKFPSATFDCSVIADKKTFVADILASLNRLKIKQLVDKKVVTVFPIDDERKSVTLRVTFEDREKTLDSNFLKEAENQVVKALADAGFPLKS